MARVLGNPSEVAVPALRPRPDHISFSQVKWLHPAYERSCPRSWAYEKLLGIPGDAGGPGLHCGKALDEGAQAFLVARLLGESPAGATMAALDCVGASCAASMLSVDYAVKVGEAMRLLSDYLIGVKPASVQEEHRFAVRGRDGQPINVLGYSDWITTDGVIVDLKWSGVARWDRDGNWHQDWLSVVRDQLTTYRMARAMDTEAYTPAPVTNAARVVVVHHGLRKKEPELRTVDLTLDRGDAVRVAARIVEADAVAARGVYPARPSVACDRCPHQSRCRTDNDRFAPDLAALGG